MPADWNADSRSSWETHGPYRDVPHAHQALVPPDYLAEPVGFASNDMQREVVGQFCVGAHACASRRVVHHRAALRLVTRHVGQGQQWRGRPDAAVASEYECQPAHTARLVSQRLPLPYTCLYSFIMLVTSGRATMRPRLWVFLSLSAVSSERSHIQRQQVLVAPQDAANALNRRVYFSQDEHIGKFRRTTHASSKPCVVHDTTSLRLKARCMDERRGGQFWPDVIWKR